MGGSNSVINAGKILAFLKNFTAGLSGYLQIEAIEPVTVKGSKASIQRKTVALDKIHDLTPFIEDHKEWNLYFRPNLLKNSQGSGEGGAAKKEDIIAGSCFHVDLDPVEPPADATEEAKRARLEEERQRIKTDLASFQPSPSFQLAPLLRKRSLDALVYRLLNHLLDGTADARRLGYRCPLFSPVYLPGDQGKFRVHDSVTSAASDRQDGRDRAVKTGGSRQ